MSKKETLSDSDKLEKIEEFIDKEELVFAYKSRQVSELTDSLNIKREVLADRLEKIKEAWEKENEDEIALCGEYVDQLGEVKEKIRKKLEERYHIDNSLKKFNDDLSARVSVQYEYPESKAVDYLIERRLHHLLAVNKTEFKKYIGTGAPLEFVERIEKVGVVMSAQLKGGFKDVNDEGTGV